MDGYRDANEAAQLRIITLEASLREKEAAVETREAVNAELRRQLKRSESAQRRPRRYLASGAGAALVGSLLASLTGTAFLVVHLSEALKGQAEARQAQAVAETEREEERAARVAAEDELDDLRSETAANAVRDKSHDVDGVGTLVAIAIGGSCEFAVDGSPFGQKSSIRISVPVGRHTVTCHPTGTAALMTQTVKVEPGKPGIASFRLN